MISIGTMIYRSTQYADWIWNSVHQYTTALHDGRARFFFVANNASQQVLDHLTKRGYPYHVEDNPINDLGVMLRNGFAGPEYIRRVYQGWNRVIRESSEICVLVSSDHAFSPGWLEPLIDYSKPDRVVFSATVEPTRCVELGIYHADFGRHPTEFNEPAFQQFVEANKRDALIPGISAYQPCCFYKSKAIEVGLYPEGNLRDSRFPGGVEYGDHNFFRRMEEAGVKPVITLNSIVYHYGEGEMYYPC